MYKKILVPLDGSPLAEKILDSVEELASEFRSSVIFLQVEEDPFILGYDEVIEESTIQRQKQRRAQMESYLIRTEKRFQEKGIETKYHIVHPPVVPNLLNVAEKEDVDLIALASHGLDGSFRTMCRSVAARLLERANKPLLLIQKVSDT
jgi:nucleotide-binding universal stress UspA family protein